MRLSARVAPGQMVVVSNLQTQQEASCRVVSVRNYPNVQGYVEIAFNQHAPGFWGVVFPEQGASAEKPAVQVSPPAPSPATKEPVPVEIPASATDSLPKDAEDGKSSKISEEPKAAEIKPQDAEPAKISTATAAMSENVDSQPSMAAEIVGALEPREPSVSDQPVKSSELSAETIAAPESEKKAEPKTPQVESDADSLVSTRELLGKLDTHVTTVSLPPDSGFHKSSHLASKLHTFSPAPNLPPKREPLRESFAHPPSMGTTPREPVPVEDAFRDLEKSLEIKKIGPKTQTAGLEVWSTTESHRAPATAKPPRRVALMAGLGVAVIVASLGTGFYLHRRTAHAAYKQTSVAPAAAPASTVAPPNNVATSDAPISTQPAGSVAAPAISSPANLAPESPKSSLSAMKAPVSKPLATAAKSNPPSHTAVPEFKAVAPTVAAPSRANAQKTAAPEAPSVLGDASTADPGGFLTNNAASSGMPEAPAPSLPVKVGGRVQEARLIHSVPPQYPTAAKENNIEGDVVADATIDARGNVTQVKIVSGPALLRQPAYDALRQWKYQPKMLDDKPIAVEMRVTLKFKLH